MAAEFVTFNSKTYSVSETFSLKSYAPSFRYKNYTVWRILFLSPTIQGWLSSGFSLGMWVQSRDSLYGASVGQSGTKQIFL